MIIAGFHSTEAATRDIEKQHLQLDFFIWLGQAGTWARESQWRSENRLSDGYKPVIILVKTKMTIFVLV